MIINGKEMEVDSEGTVTDLIASLNLKSELVVFEINGEIVPKTLYDTYWIDKRDQVEIVSFVGGG